MNFSIFSDDGGMGGDVVRTYAFAGSGQSVRFAPYAASEFTNEFRANGWSITNFQLLNANGNYTFGGRIQSDNQSATHSELMNYFRFYFSNVALRLDPYGLGTPATVPPKTPVPVPTKNQPAATNPPPGTPPPKVEETWTQFFEKNGTMIGVGVVGLLLILKR